jgi:hypothetical protein
MSRARNLIAIALMVLLVGAAAAQEPVMALRDLIGVRASSGEAELERRGYTNVGGEKTANASMTYWTDREGRCVVVTTMDGEYRGLNYTSNDKCSGEQQDVEAGPNEFETVCGVIVDGETYRYLCTAEVHHQEGQRSRTIVRYPDQTITFNWHDEREVGVRFEGMNPMRGEYSISEGETDVIVDGKTYFFISNRDAAEREVRAFKRNGGR